MHTHRMHVSMALCILCRPIVVREFKDRVAVLRTIAHEPKSISDGQIRAIQSKNSIIHEMSDFAVMLMLGE